MSSGRHSQRADEYRRWYGTAQWKAIREHQLACQPLCQYCLQSDIVEAATIADHVRPHRGDRQLFFDPTNVQSLCKPCHDKVKRLEELGHKVIRFGPDGFPID